MRDRQACGAEEASAREAALAHLWGRFIESRDPEIRSTLAESYDQLARILAAKSYSGRFSLELEFEDYLQFARVGLLEALDRFDPSRGAKFETFASRRIMGAVLSGVESLSEKQKQVSVRHQVLRERTLSQHEASKATDDAFERLAGTAIGLAIGFLLEGTGMYLADGLAHDDDCYSGAELRNLQRRVRAVVEALPEQERQVITLHYLQHEAFESIAKGLGRSKGRISQIHHAALARLRGLLGGSGLSIDI